MKKVLFYQKDTPENQIELWDVKLKKWHKNFKLVHLDEPEASEAIIALLWKAPMEKISKLKNIEAIISLGQGVDHIINDINFNKRISVYRIVDPYMAKSMSHWVILSILNYIRDYEGYKKQQINKIYKSRNFLDFKKVITVDKTREIYDCKDFEVVLDNVKNLGNFLEIEAKKDLGGLEKTKQSLL